MTLILLYPTRSLLLICFVLHLQLLNTITSAQQTIMLNCNNPTNLCPSLVAHTITCTISGPKLTWSVTPNNMATLMKVYTGTDLTPYQYGSYAITSVAMDGSNLVSTMMVIPSAKVNGVQSIQCSSNAGVRDCTVSVTDTSSPPVTPSLSQYTNTSVLLSWSPPSTPPNCVNSYIVISDLGNTTTTATSVTLNVGNENKHCAAVAAVDSANSMGDTTASLCFILDVPAKLSVLTNLANDQLHLNWTSDQTHYPPITAYYMDVFDASDTSKYLIMDQEVSNDIDSLTMNLTDTSFADSVDAIIIQITAANILGKNTGTNVTVTLNSASSSSTALSSVLVHSTLSGVTIVPSSSKAYIDASSGTAVTSSKTGSAVFAMSSLTTDRSSFSSTSKETIKETPTAIRSISSSSLNTTATPSIVVSEATTPWPAIGGAVGGVIALLVIIMLSILVCACVIQAKRKTKAAYDVTVMDDQAVNAVSLRQTSHPTSNKKISVAIPDSMYTAGLVVTDPVYDEPTVEPEYDDAEQTTTQQGKETTVYEELDLPMDYEQVQTTTQQERGQTATVAELPTDQDPVSIVRKTSTATGDLYTVHPKKAVSNATSTTVRSSANYIDLNFSSTPPRDHQLQQQTAGQSNTWNSSNSETIQYAEVQV